MVISASTDEGKIEKSIRSAFTTIEQLWFEILERISGECRARCVPGTGAASQRTRKPNAEMNYPLGERKWLVRWRS